MIQCINVSLSYGKHTILSHFSCTFLEGKINALMGQNGSGKSTLLRAMVGLHGIKEGSMCWNLDTRSIAYLPQRSKVDTTIPIRVRDVVGMGLWGQAPGLFRKLKPFDARVEKALATVGLNQYADAGLHALSGGQLQRVLLARVITQEAMVLILDEPFNGIDDASTAIILAVMDTWKQEGKTLIVALHQGKIAENFDHIVAIS